MRAPHLPFFLWYVIQCHYIELYAEPVTPGYGNKNLIYTRLQGYDSEHPAGDEIIPTEAKITRVLCRKLSKADSIDTYIHRFEWAKVIITVSDTDGIARSPGQLKGEGLRL